MLRHALALILCLAPTARAAVLWVEAETPVKSTMHRHPYWYDLVKKDQLSGGDFVTNWSDQPGEVSYRVQAPKAGTYDFWVRANPVASKLSYAIGDARWTPINLDADNLGATNIAADGKVDLRFIAWSHVGPVKLASGPNVVRFRMESANNNHGALDCFVLADEPFRPRGLLKPGQGEPSLGGWFAFDPKPDPYSPTSGIDLRFLNEKAAGDGGRIVSKGSQFVHEKTGETVRFWAVNGPSGKSRDELKAEAKMLAKHGVNLVRIHHGYFTPEGKVDPEAIRHAFDIVETMKAEGIYSHFSIYFPLWLTPKSDNPVLKGYDGKTHPFAALYFNEDFQTQYRTWWTALLTTPSPTTGKKLIDEPAVMGVEMINEDSYFFWTFNEKGIPDAQLRIVETKFGAFARQKFGSIDAALKAWGGVTLPRDNPAEGRLAFRPLWNIANERTARDKASAAFLLASQSDFYLGTVKFLHELGFRGMTTASNWATASPAVLGPLEKSSYLSGDFIDRHGYFGCRNRGEAAEWSIREGQTYADRSALRFDPEEPGKPKSFVHPSMDPSYNGKPSMISETTWNRPNRYRTEAPLFFAVYGALQDSDAIVHFALDGAQWSVKPGYFMQPWTLMAPSQMGQFPAAALIYRKGLVAPGAELVEIDIDALALQDLRGTPLPQDAAFDELRARDLPPGAAIPPGHVIDPLIHFAGRTDVRLGRDVPSRARSHVANLAPYIDRKHQVVTSTTGELRLDYGKGLLSINAPAAQGLSGSLKDAGTVKLKDLSMTSGLELGHIIAVSLDGQPLATSKRILLQAMTEEKPTGFQTEPAPGGERRIVSIGRDPWLVREVNGVVKFHRPDASRLRVTRLDPNGDPIGAPGHADAITLDPRTVYYLITN